MHSTPARGFENISWYLHQEDPYYRAARAIDGKIGALMVDDMAFHGMSPLAVAPHERARAHMQKTEECKSVVRK